VLIGQVFGRDISKLEALENVRLLGNKPYADIPSYLYDFDACLIPFLLNQVTKATDPVKLYEYLSLGKPVIATDMAELSQCGDLLYIGKDAGEFARHLDTALAERDPDLVQRRIEFARANTWTSRVQQIDAVVREAFPLVSILIVTYNSAPYVRPCLDSLLRNTSYPHYEIVLVDNASGDGTVDLAREYAERDSRVRVFPLPENRGFAGGNNYAARESRGDYLVFLNVDTMVTAGWVGRLVRHVHRDRSIGLLCPVTNFAGNEIKINVSYTCAREMERFAGNLAVAKNGQRFEIRVAPLYCALMPRAVWDQVGEMDARYEIGMFEDDDLSLRVRQAGFGVFAAEDTFIHHFGQGSFSKLAGETYNRIFETNRKRFEEKWNQPWVAHRTRPGVRPAYEEKRFDPAEFVRE
jgi:GT2 family glycosyltransferase